MPSDPNNPHWCAICGKELSLRSATTDDQGRAVHEECYLAEVKAPDESKDLAQPSE